MSHSEIQEIKGRDSMRGGNFSANTQNIIKMMKMNIKKLVD